MKKAELKTLTIAVLAAVGAMVAGAGTSVLIAEAKDKREHPQKLTTTDATSEVQGRTGNTKKKGDKNATADGVNKIGVRSTIETQGITNVGGAGGSKQ